MKIIVDIPKQDYIYIVKKHCLPSCDDGILRKVYYEMISGGMPLNEIRAEIEAKIVKRPWLNFEDRERDRNDAFLEALDIIDKYKGEGSDKE